MQDLPHHYIASAEATVSSTVAVKGRNTETLQCAPPAEFGGPGDLWSPEELLLGAVANCFILSFRAIARASKVDWLELSCTANGTLDKVERVMQFTEVAVVAELTLADESLREKAERILKKAEASCLVTNSMKAEPSLSYSIKIA